MTEDKNYPFIKNSYFPGKLLHAGDFTDEQDYHCRRSRFFNQEFAGCGIVSGLTVTPYSEGRIILSTGSCLDGCGRPIVVKETVKVRIDGLEGFAESQNGELILGISYDEKEVQSEYYSLAESENKYRASRIEETWKLKAYSMEEYRKQEKVRKAGDGEFFDSRVLYQDENVKIIQRVPLTAAAGGLFLIRLTVSCLSDRPVKLGFGCMLTLRGGLFQDTGEPFYRVHEELTAVKDTVLKDIWVRAGLGTRHPLYLDTSRYNIRIDGCCIKEAEEDPPDGDVVSLSDHTCGEENRYVSISLSDDYEEVIRTRLRERCLEEKETGWNNGDWLPLARILYATDEEETKIELIDGESVRYYVTSPVLEEEVRRIRRESGIIDGREVLPHPPGPGPHPPEPGPYPPCPGPHPPEPGPHPPGPGPIPPAPYMTPEQVREIIECKREEHIRRGVTVIPIPKHCRNGRVLYSEVISHGFPGEEVMIRYGRVWKETDYSYWERDKKRYTFFYEREDLFPPMENSGWQAAEYGLKQNLEEGTFQIAVKLTRHCRKVHEKEIAVSWTAIRTT